MDRVFIKKSTERKLKKKYLYSRLYMFYIGMFNVCMLSKKFGEKKIDND